MSIQIPFLLMQSPKILEVANYTDINGKGADNRSIGYLMFILSTNANPAKNGVYVLSKIYESLTEFDVTNQDGIEDTFVHYSEVGKATMKKVPRQTKGTILPCCSYKEL